MGTGGNAGGAAAGGAAPGGVAGGGAAAGGSASGSHPNEPGAPGGAGPGGTIGGAAGGTGGFGGTTSGTGGTGGGALGGLIGGGAPNSPDAGSAGDAGPASEAGIAAPLDGGVADGAQPDAAVEAGSPADAGLCSTGSLARVDGGCQGSYCNLTLSALADSTQPGSCIDEPTLRLACDAQLARKAAQCAQDNALSLALGTAVRSCLRRDPQLSFVSNGCLDCYTSELTCTLSNCLALCVIGLDEQCTSCRRTSCGAEFTRCSGLPGL
jgi:hypothetical protein